MVSLYDNNFSLVNYLSFQRIVLTSRNDIEKKDFDHYYKLSPFNQAKTFYQIHFSSYYVIRRIHTSREKRH